MSEHPSRRAIPARTAWAETLAYSRAVVAGRQVFVSGTLPVDVDGRPVGDDDPYRQAQQVFRLIEAALTEAGAALADVVRLRLYLRDAADLDAVARAQREAFADVRPACTIVVTALALPGFRVQADADAVMGAEG
jgi:enamine deaminase RidA (YjgF/YER057c/UK114 family)